MARPWSGSDVAVKYARATLNIAVDHASFAALYMSTVLYTEYKIEKCWLWDAAAAAQRKCKPVQKGETIEKNPPRDKAMSVPPANSTRF